jgi:hypothetical protein
VENAPFELTYFETDKWQAQKRKAAQELLFKRKKFNFST